MNNIQRQFNQIRYNNNKPKLYQDQQALQFEDNYVFRTNPSFQLSQQASKEMPKSQHWLKQQINKQDKFNRQNNKHHNKNYLVSKHQTQDYMQNNPQNEPIYLHNQKQLFKLKQQNSFLMKENRLYHNQNIKLKNYVEFLQDYNLRLKKQLMIALQRRNLDSSLGIYSNRQNEDKIQSPQILNNRYVTNKQSEKQYFQKLEPLEKYIAQPIFTNQRLSNQSHINTNSFGKPKLQNSNDNRSMFANQCYKSHNKSIVYDAFYPNKNSKKADRVYPISLQSSYLQPSYQSNQQSISYQCYNNKLCNCLNCQMPVIKNIQTPISHNQQFLRSLDHSCKCQMKNMKIKNEKIICQKCHKSCQVNQKNFKVFAKQVKNSNKNSKTQKKQKRCASCNHNKKSNAINSSKSTIPSKQRSTGNYFHSNQLSKNIKKHPYYLNSKPLRQIQKIEISQFHL